MTFEEPPLSTVGIEPKDDKWFVMVHEKGKVAQRSFGTEAEAKQFAKQEEKRLGIPSR
ncbi:hypothetical protein [Phyllobacterium sophorae]|jgi:hypothetical protein|uniref:hypothetical protein n=1 Tax=Phyllobacterium sophorae TaxID=1520277 RepID=UPI0013AF053A|nr:hypothetical protein [Phyllobacterium sophorae]